MSRQRASHAWNREVYLDVAEGIVRQGAEWLNEEGRIIDPFEGKETPTATARFVGALGALLSAGRCADLEEHCVRALTPALEDLYHVRTTWGEFIVKEAAIAFAHLRDRAGHKHVGQWTKLLSEYEPYQSYSSTCNGIKDHNFVTFAIAGEVMKQKLNLANNIDFIEACMDKELRLFDDNGMFHDPGCPITYDITARMNLTIAMWAGYDGKHRQRLADILHRGAISQLKYQSPTGECPFGGRSSQQNFNEISAAIICEYQANIENAQGDSELAGQLKQSAEIAFRSIEKYTRRSPIYFTKNMFPPETQHGRQKGYGFYGAYSLLIASQLGLAWTLADDSLNQYSQPCPAQTGPVFFLTDKGFNKLFATTSDYHLEIDLNPPNRAYDATGLGRLHRAGFPAEMALSMPIDREPGYITSIPPAPEHVVIGAGGDGKFLASIQGESLQSSVDVECRSGEEMRFSIQYSLDGKHFLTERYDMSPAGVKIEAHWPGASTMSYRIPLLKTNGRDETVITDAPEEFTVSLDTFRYRAKCLTPSGRLTFEDFDAPNRNAIYRIGRMDVPGDRIQIFLSLDMEQ